MIDNDRAMPAETWRSLAESTAYLVSDMGRVRNASTGKILFGERDKDGYRRVNLRICGKYIKRRVHRLVCEAFLGPCPEGLQCAHLDGNRLNNTVANLRWTSASENNRHKALHGTAQAGGNHPRAKLTVDQVRQIRASKLSTRKIAAQFSVAQSHIVRVRNGLSWSSNGSANNVQPI